MAQAWMKIGTRGSPLALAQAHETRSLLAAAHGIPEDRIEIVIIKVSGDQILDRPLSEAGGKGLFTKEIEHALLQGTIDLAVHSFKDVPTQLPPGLTIGAVSKREDVRDVLAACAKLPYWAALDPVRRLVVADLLFNLGAASWRRFVKANDAIARGDFAAAADELIASKWFGQVGRRGKKLTDAMRAGTWTR